MTGQLTREEAHQSRLRGAIKAAETAAANRRERARAYRNPHTYRENITVAISPEIYRWIDTAAERLNIPTTAHARNLLRALYEADQTECA